MNLETVLLDFLGNFWENSFTYAITILLGIPFLMIYFDRKTKPSNPRQEANRKIIKKLSKYIEDNPDQRFGQVLVNSGVTVEARVHNPNRPQYDNVDYYWERGVFEEPWYTIERMNKAEKEWKK